MKFSTALHKFIEWKKLDVTKGSAKSYLMVLRQFCLFIHDIHVEEVDVNHVIMWFSMMEELGYEKNSFIPRAIALRKFFEFLKMNDYQVLNPGLIPIPAKEHKQPRIATKKEYQLVLSTQPESSNDPRHIRNRALIGLLWDTGARNGELMALNIQDLVVSEKKATIKTEKNRGTRPFRRIYWSESTHISLERWLKKRTYLIEKWLQQGLQIQDGDAVFLSSVSQHRGRRLTNRGVAELLRKASEKVGIETLNAHSFRHHKARDVVEKGGDVSDVANILGHASYLSSKPYLDRYGDSNEKRSKQFLEESL